MNTIIQTLSLIFLTISLSLAQTNMVLFHTEDYPDSSFSVTRKIYDHGSIRIELIQAQRVNEEHLEPFYCRSWLNIFKGSTLIEQKYFPDIEPVGASFGLFVPEPQPSQVYFTLIKLGDYDGNLFLIDKNGYITEYLGGEFLTSGDNKYLFSVYYSGAVGIEVIDLTNGKSLFRATDFPYPTQWYALGNNYFFTTQDFPDSVYTWDLLKMEFHSSPLNQINLKNAKILSKSYLPAENNNCTCKK